MNQNKFPFIYNLKNELGPIINKRDTNQLTWTGTQNDLNNKNYNLRKDYTYEDLTDQQKKDWLDDNWLYSDNNLRPLNDIMPKQQAPYKKSNTDLSLLDYLNNSGGISLKTYNYDKWSFIFNVGNLKKQDTPNEDTGINKIEIININNKKKSEIAYIITFSPGLFVVPSDKNHIFLPENFIIQGINNPWNKQFSTKDLTWFTDNLTEDNVKNHNDFRRRGFVMNNNTVLRNCIICFCSDDTSIPPGNDNLGLVGGAVIELPGCKSVYSAPYANNSNKGCCGGGIDGYYASCFDLNNNYGAQNNNDIIGKGIGVSNILVENIIGCNSGNRYNNGNYYSSGGPFFWSNMTADNSPHTHIYFKNVWCTRSGKDGYNLHGRIQHVYFEYVYTENCHDDSYAIWSNIGVGEKDGNKFEWNPEGKNFTGNDLTPNTFNATDKFWQKDKVTKPDYVKANPIISESTLLGTYAYPDDSTRMDKPSIKNAYCLDSRTMKQRNKQYTTVYDKTCPYECQSIAWNINFNYVSGGEVFEEESGGGSNLFKLYGGSMVTINNVNLRFNYASGNYAIVYSSAYCGGVALGDNTFSVENYTFNKTDNRDSNDSPCDIIQYESNEPCNSVVTWNNGGYEFNKNWTPYKEDNKIIIKPPYKTRSEFG